MTANEMWANVLVTYDALYSQSAPGFEDAEASILLTKAQWYYISQTLNPKNNRNQEGFEETEVRIQGLSALVKDSDQAIDPPTTTGVNLAGQLPNETFFTLPEDFMFAIYEAVYVNKLKCGAVSTTNPLSYSRIPVVPVSHDEYNLNVANPYKNPWTDGTQGIVWRLENRPQFIPPIVGAPQYKIHGLITDGSFTITKYFLRYLKKPEDINVDNITPATQSNSELADFTHQAICDIAIKLLSAAVREQIPINQLTADMLE
jgi:hypothetical protein